MVVDFLATLFVTFCIGVATALVLGACVALMAGEVHGAAPAESPGAPTPCGIPAAAAELVRVHTLTAGYLGGPAGRLGLQAGSPPGCAPAPTGARRGVSRRQTVQIFAASR